MNLLKSSLISLLLIAELSANASGEGIADRLPELRMSLYKKSVVEGEPLVITLRLINPFRDTVRGYFKDNEAFANGTICIKGSTANGALAFEQTYSLGARQLWGLSAMLEPGDSLQTEKICLPFVHTTAIENRIRLLPPGQYRVAATVQTVQLIPSASLEFEVQRAQGEDAKAVPLMAMRSVMAFLSGLDFSRSLPDESDVLLTKFPRSAYPPYLRLRLILNKAQFLWRNRGGKLSDTNKQQISQTIADGTEFVREHRDMPLADNVMLDCARLQWMLDQEDRSIQTLTRIVEQFPKGDAEEAAIRHLEVWTPDIFRQLPPEKRKTRQMQFHFIPPKNDSKDKSKATSQ